MQSNLAAGHAQNRHRRRIDMAQLGQEECRAKESNTLHNLKSKNLRNCSSSRAQLRDSTNDSYAQWPIRVECQTASEGGSQKVVKKYN